MTATADNASPAMNAQLAMDGLSEYLTYVSGPIIRRELDLVRYLSQRADEVELELDEANQRYLEIGAARSAKMKAEAEELLSKIEAREDELLSLRKEVLAVVQKILVTVEEDRSELQSVGEVVATAAAIEEDEIAAQQKEANTSEIDDETPTAPTAKKIRLTGTSTSSPRDTKSDSVTESAHDTETVPSPEPSTELWCVCKKPDDGSYMVGCDRGDKCKVQWWHPQCAKDYIARRGYGLPPPENEADARRAHFSTEDGFRVYSIDPFKPAFSRRFRDVIPVEGEPRSDEPTSSGSSSSRRAEIAAASGGIGIVEMLYRCNILALVGGGRNPRFAPHKVILWDDRHPRPLAELSFRTTVRAVRMRRDMIVVAIDSKVYVYRFSDLTLIDSITTGQNPRGIMALSQDDDRAVLATVADQQKGRVRVSVYDVPLSTEARGPSRSSVILAHDSQISQLALDKTGSLLATSSDKGTLIRIHDTETGHLLQELRRGVDRADICSIVFHPTGRWVVVSSDKVGSTDSRSESTAPWL
ncbi:WD repeat domain phosphoinositide-interacting protein 3, variant 2 [Perkinsus olseni]|uniref:WD repeat domain phosphoinositide-interacting protein 3, variant 2 n=1 Tax=Perkinsus olseni TaxID=32597 RepID=A0A7J6Q9G6_PEROL|nr:WD repeat domain phosphoinositide-interacting protein 3, variant 2 [Perkinsus olseni]